MNVSFQIATYLAILRKHLVLLLVSAGIIISGGFAYLYQQAPVYQASAKLQISVPERSVMAARDVVSPFSINRQKLNTEIHLLRDNEKLSTAVIEKLREQGLDPEAEGYSEGGLRGSVQVDFISGTDLVRFSLTGSSPKTLPAAVNAYAAVYKATSEEKSQRTYKGELAQLQENEEKATDALRVATTERTAFRNQHKDLEWGLRENRFSARARELAGLLPGIENEALRAKGQRGAMDAALARLRITALRDPSGYTLTHNSESGQSLEDLLVDDEVIVAFRFIESNSEVTRLLEQERAAARRDRDLAQRGDLIGTDARRAARADLSDTRSSRGRKMVQLVRKALSDMDDVASRFSTLDGQLTEVREKELVENRLLAGMMERDERIEERQRDYESARDRKDKFMQMFVTESGMEEPDLGLRVDIRVKAKGAAQIAPNRTAILGLTFFAAFAISLGLVLLFEYLDDTIKSREDFDRYVGLPFLGFVPHIADGEADNRDLAADSKPGTPIAEAFRAIRTSVMFSRGGAEVRRILVTSAGPGEGKTTVAANLAATLAKNKAPVLLIDADLRRPRVAKALRLPNTTGLTNCLIGDAKLDDVVMETAVEGLYVLASGPIPPNPAELLHGERMEQLLAEAGEKYDRIVIDSPPVVAVTDARVLASQVDGLYMVISMGKTSRRVIQRAVESITSIGFAVHGAILNNLSQPAGRYGYYYYRDYTYGKGYYRNDETDSKAS